jgi:hypothetical protein
MAERVQARIFAPHTIGAVRSFLSHDHARRDFDRLKPTLHDVRMRLHGAAASRKNKPSVTLASNRFPAPTDGEVARGDVGRSEMRDE